MPFNHDDQVTANGIISKVVEPMGQGKSPTYNSDFRDLRDVKSSTVGALIQSCGNVTQELQNNPTSESLPNMISEASHHVAILDAVAQARADIEKQK